MSTGPLTKYLDQYRAQGATAVATDAVDALTVLCSASAPPPVPWPSSTETVGVSRVTRSARQRAI
ncbi:hypothetical protein, partial [Nocardia sp. NPDC024068]|uniref:hypothetical protein n=1 Tax=Nocardia sp. NPDC024068 TaxID=3157197 RepID=UPI00340B885D